MRRFIVVILLLAGVLVWFISARRSAPGVTAGAKVEATSLSAKKPDYNVILISIDTLRADRLGCYGYDRPTSPSIDALAARGVRFSRVVVEASWTLPSHMSLFTGLHPSSHGVTLANQKLSPERTTLPEVMQRNGRRTFGSTAGGFMDGGYGFARGFEQYDDKRIDFSSTIDQFYLWRQSLTPDERYFAFLHTYDVHCPYDPQEHYAAEFRTQPVEDQIDTRGRCGNPYYNSMHLRPGQIRHLSDQYDASIREADDVIARLMSDLDAENAWSNTVVVLLSDHGEEFGEHGQIGHERTLYIESLLVPLIVVAPEIKPRVVDRPVGLVDVMPTLLDLLGMPSPPTQGTSMVQAMHFGADDAAQRPMYSELDRQLHLRSVVRGSHHLIYQIGADTQALFDFVADPREGHDLSLDRSDLVEQLHTLATEKFRNLAAPTKAPKSELSPEQLERLRSLGYVGD